MEIAQNRASPASNRLVPPKRDPRLPPGRESSAESEDTTPAQLTYTLTACTRCRQRKTRCDPTLPKCLSCERSGQLCEYWDPIKKQKVPRYYVLRLMEHVRSMEAELNRLIEEDGPPRDAESLLRPGGIVRLHENDDAPRYLGPSSGVPITRIVMEEAKKYMDTRKIRDLVPEIRGRNMPPLGRPSLIDRKMSYPMISAVPAKALPSRPIADNLMKVFNEKAQMLWPVLHEPSLKTNFDDVYDGSADTYKNFIVRIVLAISLQKVDLQYAGLADSFYLAAIENLEEVVKLKDLRTLQCLVLISQYSLVAPTKTAIYYIIGLATRLCQQLGLTEERTIGGGMGLQLYNPLEVDMRRRLLWIVLSMESGLAHILGRPNAFATGKDHIDVQFFSLVEDANISEYGITSGPESTKKAVAIHFFKMRAIQSEIRRVLYQTKRLTPKNCQDPWFSTIQASMDEWHQNCPSEAKSIMPWFTDRYNTIVVFLNRPSPQIPQPSAQQALKCYEAAANILHMQERGIEEVTWIFVATTHMLLNTLLWSISYPEVRNAHPREESERNIEGGISMLDKSRERWPSHVGAIDHYSRLAKAILMSYQKGPPSNPSSSSSETPPALGFDPNSPNSEYSSTTTGSAKYSQNNDFTPTRPHFTDNVFGLTNKEQFLPQRSLDYNGLIGVPNSNHGLPQPFVFRSGSIFAKPGSMQNERRGSYFPPEVRQQQLPDWTQNLTQEPLENTGCCQETNQPQALRPGQRAMLAQAGPHDMDPFSVTSAPQNMNTFPRDIVDQKPFMTNSVPRNMNAFSPNAGDQKPIMTNSMPPGQQPLPSPNFFSAVENSSADIQYSYMTNNWDPLGNPFGNDYEMHDRMGSLSQEQQIELMEYLESDADFIHNMQLNTGQSPWETMGMI